MMFDEIRRRRKKEEEVKEVEKEELNAEEKS